jgi:outer membrane protein TolC
MTHAPTPEFRAALEREVIEAFREQRPSRFSRFRIPMTLAAGLVLGMATQLAVGQVQKQRERSELEISLDVKRAIAGSRLELAKAAYEQAKKSFDVGATSMAALLAAEAEVREQEAAAYRLQADLQEVRETANAPRDELWAPLVNGRDFVRDRLNADAAAAQKRLASAEAAASEVERSFNAGVATKAALEEARTAVEQARSDLDLTAYKLTLRRQALDQQATPQVITQRLERFEVARGIQRTQLRMQLLQNYYATASLRVAAGAVDSLELLRLRVKLLETSEEIRRLQAQLQRLPRPE